MAKMQRIRRGNHVDSDEEGDADGPGSGEEKEETRIEKLKKKLKPLKKDKNNHDIITIKPQ